MLDPAIFVRRRADRAEERACETILRRGGQPSLELRRHRRLTGEAADRGSQNSRQDSLDPTCERPEEDLRHGAIASLLPGYRDRADGLVIVVFRPVSGERGRIGQRVFVSGIEITGDGASSDTHTARHVARATADRSTRGLCRSPSPLQEGAMRAVEHCDGLRAPRPRDRRCSTKSSDGRKHLRPGAPPSFDEALSSGDEAPNRPQQAHADRGLQRTTDLSFGRRHRSLEAETMSVAPRHAARVGGSPHRGRSKVLRHVRMTIASRASDHRDTRWSTSCTGPRVTAARSPTSHIAINR